MIENLRNIAEARTYESAIEIIPESVCRAAVFGLKLELSRLVGNRTSDFVVVPVVNGGSRIGSELVNYAGMHQTLMKMSYYGEENVRLPEPICEIKPDIDQIIVGGRVRHVIFAEGVVETEATIIKSIEIINSMIDEKSRGNGVHYPYPSYHTYALISKVSGTPHIPDFVYPLWVDPRIWVHGWGVDNNQRGRSLYSIYGVLSPYADSIPERPYFRTTSVYERGLKATLLTGSRGKI